MRLRVLGCSGGMGGNARTAAFLLDHDVLIEAGTGVGELSLAEISQINHVFITHTHFDHIASLPILIDSVGYMRSEPITVYGTKDMLETLHKYIFNWEIWPDFTRIPSREDAYLRFKEIELGQSICLNGRSITPLPANHVVPTVGYHLDSGQASLVYSGDTTSNDELWHIVNKIDNLRYLVIETAFSDEEAEIARLSKHLCPTLLAAELKKMSVRPEVYITHLKPGKAELTMRQIKKLAAEYAPRMLLNNQLFEF